jgi:hypothetical protein
MSSRWASQSLDPPYKTRLSAPFAGSEVFRGGKPTPRLTPGVRQAHLPA